MKNFVTAAGIRAARTAAQTAAAYLAATGITLIEDLDFATMASLSALAALGSALTSLATGLPEIEDGDSGDPLASLIDIDHAGHWTAAATDDHEEAA